jgi:hypothetical protein
MKPNSVKAQPIRIMAIMGDIMASSFMNLSPFLPLGATFNPESFLWPLQNPNSSAGSYNTTKL